MSDPALSIVIVNYNAGPMLDACVGAVRRTDVETQCIVVDNGSTDGSIERLEAEYGAGVEIVRNGENLGFARGVNAGYRRAVADRILILNPDCLVMPRALERMLSLVDRDSRIGIVGGLVVNIDGSEQRGCRRREPTPGRIARRMLSPLLRLFGTQGNGIDLTGHPLSEKPEPVDAVSGAFMLVTRGAMERVAGMDEGYFLHFEDLDICRRVRDAGFSVVFSGGALAIHLKSASGNADRYRVERHKRDGLLRYLGKFYAREMRGPAITMVRFVSAFHLSLSRLTAPTHRDPNWRNDPTGARDDPRSRLVDVARIAATPRDQWLVLTGASSQVGDYLVERLRQSDYVSLAVTRGERAGMVAGNVWWVKPAFLEILAMSGVTGILCWLHAAPIWLMEDFGPVVTRLRPARIIALSSTSIATKRDSRSKPERRTVEKLEHGERMAFSIAENTGCRVTIFRPSMIYGNRKNKNVELIRRWVRWFGVFPLPGDARGKRQPVHAEDVAAACLKSLSQPATFGRIYTLAGSEVIEFKEMIGRIFSSRARSGPEQDAAEPMTIATALFALPLSSFLVTLLVLHVMLKKEFGLFADVPNVRSLHERVVPRGGGIGFVSTILAVWLIAQVALFHESAWVWYIFPFAGSGE